MPAQTPPSQPAARSRLMRPSFSPAETVREQDRPRYRARDGGEEAEAEVDQPEGVEEEHGTEREEGEAGDQGGDVRSSRSHALPCPRRRRSRPGWLRSPGRRTV